MGKKSLEQLFKETFQEFHEVPDEKVWQSIEASLDKKKKKRVVPIWWQLGGVAALLAILFYVINPFGDTAITVEPIITETERKDAPLENDGLIENSEANRLTDAAEDKDGLNTTNGVVESALEMEVDNNGQNMIHNGQGVVSVESSKKDKAEDRHAGFKAVDSYSQQRTLTENLSNKNTEEQQEKSQIAEVSEKGNGTEIASIAEKEPTKSSDIPKDDQLLQEEKRLKNLQEKEAIAQNKEEFHNTEKKSIFEAIEEQEEEAIAQNNNRGKWSVGAAVAPVYFGSTGEGSPIHSNFAPNSKSGNVNLSYGLTVAYNLNKKLKIRSGVHRVNYGYDTNEIVFSSSFGAAANGQIDNIDYSQTSRNLVVESKSGSNALSEVDTFAELSAQSPELDGKMVQQLGYIEVPLELNYALLDKKFGVDLIGGISSLFLVDNSILLESNELVTEMGEANNANSVNFSTNVGVGLNYEFSPKVQLNLEPVFKYQLNTFSETSGNFRPFSVGVYSGVRFNF